MTRKALALIALLVAAAACSPDDSPAISASAAQSPPGESPVANPAPVSDDYRVQIDPANFVPAIDNPYFPLKPGTTFRFSGTGDGEEETSVFEVTRDTKTILGVTTTVVRDRVYVAGELAEDTLDWYAQDDEGNVWYFGEDSKDIEDGKVVSTKGSWEAGKDGAHPGVVMLGSPAVGTEYREEFYRGEAEDVAKVIATDESVTVPAGSYTGVLVTENRNPLEPDVIERKYYARGVGVVYEKHTTGPKAELKLVEIAP